MATPELNEVAIADLEARMAAVEIKVFAAVDQCTAEAPHGDMTWNGSRYTCPCGKVYAKLHPGKLVEVIP